MGNSYFPANFGKDNSSSQPSAIITTSPHRRMLSRRNSPPLSSSTPSTSPTRSSSISLQSIFHHTSRSTSPVPTTQLQEAESDEECWARMLELQMEYHCYKSARLEAAVEARKSGCSFEEIRRRKFCTVAIMVPQILTACSFEIMSRSSE